MGKAAVALPHVKGRSWQQMRQGLSPGAAQGRTAYGENQK